MSTSFHNMSSAQIVDEYGPLNLQAKAIEVRLKDLKIELIRRDVESESGDNFSLDISEQISVRLDSKRLKEELAQYMEGGMIKFLMGLEDMDERLAKIIAAVAENLAKEALKEFETVSISKVVRVKNALPKIQTTKDS